jgi:CRISPR-associated protein Cmr2
MISDYYSKIIAKLSTEKKSLDSHNGIKRAKNVFDKEHRTKKDVKKAVEQTLKNFKNSGGLLVIFKYFEAKGNSNRENVKQVYVETTKNAHYETNFAKETFSKIDKTALNILPPYSFIIKFGFTLEKPYISKDDENFTIIENSIKREKVLGCPYIPGSTWKGCLRSALWQDGKKENDKQIIRIFGNEKAEKNDFRQGRLHFFPSFFSKSDFEVINPHDRKTRTGTNPILIECVPAGESSDFSLLYVPFDLVGKEPIEIKQQMLNDLKLITEGLKAMFTVYGFGAKTSSGYGIASSLVKNGKIYNDLSIKLESETEAIEIPENFKKYYNEDGTVKKELIDEKTGELLSNKKFQEKKSEHGFQSGNKFSKFKRWFEENGESYMNSLSVKDSSENVGEFSSFAELMDLTKAIADANAQPDTAGGNPDE